jgi:hypothetical protein
MGDPNPKVAHLKIISAMSLNLSYANLFPTKLILTAFILVVVAGRAYSQ